MSSRLNAGRYFSVIFYGKNNPELQFSAIGARDWHTLNLIAESTAAARPEEPGVARPYVDFIRWLLPKEPKGPNLSQLAEIEVELYSAVARTCPSRITRGRCLGCGEWQLWVGRWRTFT